ncbi:MAG: hypothetical protein Kow00129_08280 [Thermoleophilia bacterium]
MERLPGFEATFEPLRHRLEVQGSLDNARLVREFVEGAATEAGLSSERVFDVKVAVAEAFANAVEHACRGRGTVTLEVYQHPGRLQILIRNPQPFTLTGEGPVEREEHRGFGLPLMALLADRLSVRRTSDGGTVVSLTFLTRAEALLEPLVGHDPFETMTDGFLTLDRDWRITYLNSTAASYMRRPRHELLGRVLWEVLPDPMQKELRRYESAMEREEAPAFELYLPIRDTWIEVRSHLSPDGLAVYFADIGERKQREQLIKETAKREELLAALLQTSSQPFFRMRPNGKPILFNQAFLDLTGYSGKELTECANCLDDLTPDDWRKVDAEVIERLEKTRRPARYTKELRRKDGSLVPVEVLLHTRRDEQGQYFFGFITDISERRRLQEETERERRRHQERERLSEALNLITDSVNDVAKSSLDEDLIIQTALRGARKALNADYSILGRCEEDLWIISVYDRERDERIAHHHLQKRQAPYLNTAAQANRIVEYAWTNQDARPFQGLEHLVPAKVAILAPLKLRDETIGVFGFGNRGDAGFDQAQLDFTQKLMTSLSLTLENARLLEEHRNTAETLQDSLLEIPRSIEGIEFSHAYQSSTEAALVGGDFYDVFRLEAGCTALVIGDACGHGVRAAREATFVRDILRGFLARSQCVQEALADANRALIRFQVGSRYTTVFVGILHHLSGRLDYASAGHPPPALKGKGDVIDFLDPGSLPLGVTQDTVYRRQTQSLKSGDVLLLYTDGLTEARKNGEFFGEGRLAATLAGLTFSPNAAEAMIAEAISFAGGSLRDDVAAVAVRLSARNSEDLQA